MHKTANQIGDASRPHHDIVKFILSRIPWPKRIAARFAFQNCRHKSTETESQLMLQPSTQIQSIAFAQLEHAFAGCRILVQSRVQRRRVSYDHHLALLQIRAKIS
jgi:hypothetical protein